jgi:uncharacterized protein YjbI with pentapeptide repeats
MAASKLKEQSRSVTKYIQEKTYNNPLGFIMAFIIIAILAWIVWKTYKLDNLGFDKTLWDWMDLLIIPVMLGSGAWLLTQLSQTRENLEILKRTQQDQEAAFRMQQNAIQEETLAKYLEHMTKLLVDKGLRSSPEIDDLRIIARARTLSILRDLDHERKGQVLRFLYESNLINSLIEEKGERKSAIINLEQSDLTGVVLPGIRLNEAVLNGANLNGANLQGAFLSKVSLIRSQLQSVKLDNAKLEDADLSEAQLNPSWLNRALLKNARLSKINLERAYLHNADLTGAKLDWSILKGAELVNTKLISADLTGADLTGADLTGADLTGAIVTIDQLCSVNVFDGAIMPDGSSNYKNWVKV